MGLESFIIVETNWVVTFDMLSATSKRTKDSRSMSYACLAVPLSFDLALLSNPMNLSKTSSAVDALLMAVARGLNWLAGHFALHDCTTPFDARRSALSFEHTGVTLGQSVESNVSTSKEWPMIVSFDALVKVLSKLTTIKEAPVTRMPKRPSNVQSETTVDSCSAAK